MLDNNSFLKDILQGISTTDLNDEDLNDIKNKLKNDKKDNDDK